MECELLFDKTMLSFLVQMTSTRSIETDQVLDLLRRCQNSNQTQPNTINPVGIELGPCAQAHPPRAVFSGEPPSAVLPASVFEPQTPSSQRCCPLQGLSQAPQCCALVFVSTQAPPQKVRPVKQALAFLQTPPKQSESAGHCFEQPPQWFLFLLTSIQRLSQSSIPEGHCEAHAEDAHTCPA